MSDSPFRFITRPGEDIPSWIEYDCPGCAAGFHRIPVRPNKGNNGASWAWDGNRDRPTLDPSIHNWLRHPEEGKKTLCHHFLRNGCIEFCSDSPHKLAGTTVDLLAETG